MSFAFNASALAFGGRIQQPSSDVIPSQASVALAPSGGEGYETVRNFDYKGIITFDEASVYVSGSEHGDIRNTLASVTIKNLNVLNLLHADLLSSRITSRHVLGELEGEITFHGTSAENLRIGGKPANVNFNHDFFARYPTHEKLAAAFAAPAEESDIPVVRELINADAQNSRSGAYQSPKKRVAELLADRYCWNPKDCVNGAPNDHDSLFARGFNRWYRRGRRLTIQGPGGASVQAPSAAAWIHREGRGVRLDQNRRIDHQAGRTAAEFAPVSIRLSDNGGWNDGIGHDKWR
jgi:hypothetical protein